MIFCPGKCYSGYRDGQCPTGDMQQAMYPDKQICFTELGWATNTAHADHADYASVANQKRYLEEVADYLKSEEIVSFVFEAFDELWKDPSSPAASECNWGIYDINRKKKW